MLVEPPRDISGAEAVRALERLGFAVVRRWGSHGMMLRRSVGCVVLMRGAGITDLKRA